MRRPGRPCARAIGAPCGRRLRSVDEAASRCASLPDPRRPVPPAEVRRGPWRYWAPMTDTAGRGPVLSPARTIPILVAGLLAGVVVIAMELTSDHQDARIVWAVFGPAVGWSFIGTGLYAWGRRPESRTGALMVLLGFAWFLFCLDAANGPAVHTFALVGGGLWGGVFLPLGLSFPTGRLGAPLDRRLASAGYAIFPLAFVPA